ncbi:MAG: histidinol dehydrogenase [Halanaerobium sp. 4-GBenrich]|nr:histidinol dehydrogenase [Halanaerobium congolense]KXS48998.1 MAG: histidinol dehydrogenase [Halanaerobium sp. T82-1]ODS50271.1 MAG: histidinol dehydrogenase [Halanaerobium sp. 4-GBenrich]TDP09437.1 histidinol dehydrogenase [Halanaerobium congolense]SDK41899.1 histidinol dehydrogenase [Halanaerobium congolense]SDN11664.1 histidinol dehydrogenase [Halanaerobium congolense]
MLKIKRIKDGRKNVAQVKELLDSRSGDNLSQYREIAADILKNVKANGDQAVLEYTSRFDGIKFKASELEVTEAEIKTAVKKVDKDFIKALKNAAANIEEFHVEQKDRSWQKLKKPGIITGQICQPLKKAGVYVPGGRAAYPSSVLMTVIPAKVAGVEEIVMLTPPDQEGKVSPVILAAADIAGVDRIFKVGGAQAVAAAAYGTETIPGVDIIVGPGNIYVSMAKELVFGQVKIDMIAGPSEIMIMAEKDSNPAFIAADLMSQAEHDPLASSILVTDAPALIKEVEKELEEQITGLNKKEIIKESLESFGLMIEVEDQQAALEMINLVAPEHLELAVKNPFELLPAVENAGSIFLGEYTPEPVGDYYAGPNHVLPTNSTARFFSPLSVRDFVKYSGFIHYSQEALNEASADVICLAEGEGLDAHANSVRIRKEN